MSLQRSFAIVAEHEGGWADDVHDRGGRTRWGISSRAHPDVDLDLLHTFDDAVRLVYVPRYWDQIRGDVLTEPLDLTVLDFAVHSGTKRAVKALQTAIGKPPSWPHGKHWVDGRVGMNTLRRLSSIVLTTEHAQTIALKVNEIRIQFFARGFRKGIFVAGEKDRETELKYLWNFWRRSSRISFEIGRGRV